MRLGPRTIVWLLDLYGVWNLVGVPLPTLPKGVH